MPKSKKKFGLIIRNFVFGVEDSLVSTVGLLSGIASVGVAKRTIFLTGTVLILVEAVSMATGSFLSEESTEEYETRKSKIHSRPLIASLVMFFSYFISGFIPLLPYYLLESPQDFEVSILGSLFSLFILGILSAKFGRKNFIRKGIEMLILGSLAIAAGILVGNLINNF